MTEWGIAIIAAGSAILGSLVTGWLSRSAGLRQAAAARHAGDRQADALLETVRLGLEEQRSMRFQDVRRQAYVRFLQAAETAVLVRRTGHGSADADELHRAFGAVRLEGPAEVAAAAQRVVDKVTGSRSLDDLEEARQDFLRAGRNALGYPEAPPTTDDSARPTGRTGGTV